MCQTNCYFEIDLFTDVAFQCLLDQRRLVQSSLTRRTFVLKGNPLVQARVCSGLFNSDYGDGWNLGMPWGLGRAVKTSKMQTSTSAENLRFYEVYLQKTLNVLNLNYSQNLILNLKNAALILTSNFEVLFKDPKKPLIFLGGIQKLSKQDLKSVYNNLWTPQNYKPHPHLEIWGI